MSNDFPTIEYTTGSVNDLHVITEKDDKDRDVIKSVLVNDEPIRPTNRFWNSLFARFGFNSSIFNYFSHAEVFDRISQVRSDDRMRLCIERPSTGSTPLLLAVSAPTTSVAKLQNLNDLAMTYGGKNVTYHDGVFESTHVPHSGTMNSHIGPDEFGNTFMLSCPVDGYGRPSTYISLIRQVCTNGAIAMSKMFRQEIAIGRGNDDISASLVRVLEGFGNDEGYAAIRQRILASQATQASVYEALQLQKILTDAVVRGNVPTSGGDDATGQAPVIGDFIRMTGNVSSMYGVANPDSLAVKRQHFMPMRCTVYDLINYATEVATHRAAPAAARKLQAWFGSTIGLEYDLEGTQLPSTDFAAYHLSDLSA